MQDPYVKEVRIPFLNENTSRYSIKSCENRPTDNGVHHYVVSAKNKQGDEDYLQFISFQDTPLTEADQNHNGILSTVYLQLLIDHLQQFQDGIYKNRETALAITNLQQAYQWLASRADERASRGVLGFHKQ